MNPSPDRCGMEPRSWSDVRVAVAPARTARYECRCTTRHLHDVVLREPPSETQRVRQHQHRHRLALSRVCVCMCRYGLIQLFKPFGTIVREEFQWHLSGQLKGMPKGYAFIQFETHAVCTEVALVVLDASTDV